MGLSLVADQLEEDGLAAVTAETERTDRMLAMEQDQAAEVVVTKTARTDRAEMVVMGLLDSTIPRLSM